MKKVAAVLQHTDVEVTTIGKRYLRGAIGNDWFVEEFVKERVAKWVREDE